MNLVEGRGLTWNPGERVQAYTNPLWMFLIAGVYAICGEINVAVLSLSIVTSLAAIGFYAWKLPKGPLAAILGLAILGMSKAFIDFSTSGLENPLTHLLMLVFYATLLRESRSRGALLAISSAAGFCCMNRMDTILLFAPGILLVWWECAQQRNTLKTNSATDIAQRTGYWRASMSVLCGFLPIALWIAFATLYYGFPFPNTAYAKLNVGADPLRMLQQGWYYLLNSLRLDPLTPMIIVAGLLSPLALRSRAAWAIGLGCALYLAYVMRIGGDFMSGRMIAAPLLAGVVLLTGVIRLPASSALPALLVVTIVGMSNPLAPIHKLDDYLSGITLFDNHWVADERYVYSPWTRLVDAPPRRALQNHPYWERGLQFRRIAESRTGVSAFVCAQLGFTGAACGPQVHIVDEYALADVLLARMPVRPDSDFRIGHFSRSIPAGYVESIEAGENQLTDPRQHRMLDQIWLITRGSLFSTRRLQAIVDANLRGL